MGVSREKKDHMSAGERKTRELASKVTYKTKKTLATLPTTEHKKRDQGITARRKNSVGVSKSKRK